MSWYSIFDAQRDAEKQRQIRESANLPTRSCPTFCAYEAEKRCAITNDGECAAARKEKP